MKLYLKNKPKQKRLRSSSCGREPATQLQNPEFKPQYHWKKRDLADMSLRQ
jgi:hypothetical protein